MKLIIPLSSYIFSIIINTNASSSSSSSLSSINNKNVIISNKQNKIRSGNKNRKLSDIFNIDVDGATTATIDRYYKEPTKRNVPFSTNTSNGSGYSNIDDSNSYCVLDGAGIYGSSGSLSTSISDEMMPLLFDYELEVLSSLNDDNLESTIIPDLEQAIGVDLASDVNICTISRRNKKRDLQDLVVGTMQGVGLLPVDQINTTKTCTSDNDSTSTSCVYVNGQMTLYYIPSNEIRRGNEIQQSSLNIVQNNMNSGKYNSGTVNSNIIRVTYTGPTTSSTPTSEEEQQALPISNINQNPTNPPEGTPSPVGRESFSQKAYGYVIIASCAVLAVVAIIFVRRKSIIHQNNNNNNSGLESLSSNNNFNSSQQLQSIDKDINMGNDQTTITTAITKEVPPDLEISVTDTTDVSTMGSPSSTDDSSVSTLGVSMGCPSNESMELEQHIEQQQQELSSSSHNNRNNEIRDNTNTIASGTITATNIKRPVPAPLLGGQDEDEKSYQDDELLFTS